MNERDGSLQNIDFVYLSYEKKVIILLCPNLYVEIINFYITNKIKWAVRYSNIKYASIIYFKRSIVT